MAWRTEKNGQDIDIVIDGWENGISDDPYEGLADMRNVNPLSTPKEVGVAFANAAVTLPPVLTTVAFTATASNDTLTIASTTGFYTGMAIIINTIAAGAAGLSATAGSNVYYVKTFTSTTFTVSKNLNVASTLDITTDGNGTLSTAQFGTPFDSVRGINASSVTQSNGQLVQYTFILDSLGQVWIIGNGSDSPLNSLQFAGNTNRTTLTTTGSLGICIFKNYLFVFIENKIDYIALSDLFGSSGPFGNWHIGWQTTTGVFSGHKAIAATDDAMYFCNAHAVGSVLQNAGSTFDPATSSTYTYNASALALPTYDYAKSIAQLGTTLLIGGVQNYVYPWDRISTSFNYPLIVAESYVKNIVSTNSTAYIFAGKRGRIYITNGANIQLYKKFPDQLSNTETPYYNWGDAVYLRNQLYFGISATTNGGSAINNFSGVWAIDLDQDFLYMLNSLSTASYAGSVPVLLPMGNVSPLGNALYVGWINGSGTGGVDYGTGSPYTSTQAYIDTDIIPVGTYYKPQTDQQIEYKLAKPLVSGESVTIAWRGNLTDSFTTVFTDSTVGAISGAGKVNFQKQQWVQLRITLTSTATNPSYTRLREVRLR